MKTKNEYGFEVGKKYKDGYGDVYKLIGFKNSGGLVTVNDCDILCTFPPDGATIDDKGLTPKPIWEPVKHVENFYNLTALPNPTWWYARTGISPNRKVRVTIEEVED